MAVIFPFGEGPTDRIVFDFLRREFFSDIAIQDFVPVNGKNNFRSRIERTVQADVLPNSNHTILVFRDRDAGESVAHIVQAFRDIVWGLLSDWDLRPDIQPHQQYPNIYVCAQPLSTTAPGLRLILHLADNKALDLPADLRNDTTDGYVLAASLTEIVLDRFAAKAHSNTQAIHRLVTDSGSVPQFP